jgi:hypothetical protein
MHQLKSALRERGGFITSRLGPQRNYLTPPLRVASTLRLGLVALGRFVRCRLRKRTPGPPPFSSMNSRRGVTDVASVAIASNRQAILCGLRKARVNWCPPQFTSLVPLVGDASVSARLGLRRSPK